MVRLLLKTDFGLANMGKCLELGIVPVPVSAVDMAYLRATLFFLIFVASVARRGEVAFAIDEHVRRQIGWQQIRWQPKFFVLLIFHFFADVLRDVAVEFDDVAVVKDCRHAGLLVSFLDL